MSACRSPCGFRRSAGNTVHAHGSCALVSDAKPRYLGAVGQFREPQTDIMLPEMQLLDSGAVTGRQLADSMQGMSRIFDVVRLVDPKRGKSS